MRQDIANLAAEFSKIRDQAPPSAGGKRKKLVYPSHLRTKAADLFRADPDVSVNRLAKALGVSESGLSKWLKQQPPSRTTPTMIPLRVEETKTDGSGPSAVKALVTPSRAAITLVSRELTLKLPANADTETLAALVRMLAAGGDAC